MALLYNPLIKDNLDQSGGGGVAGDQGGVTMSNVVLDDIGETYYLITPGATTVFNYENGLNQEVIFDHGAVDTTASFINWPTAGVVGALFSKITNGGEIVFTFPLNAAIITAQITISADTTDDSFNDSGSGFGATIVAGDRILVSGFTNAANNGYFTVREAATTGKIKVFANLATEVAGDSVTIERLVMRIEGDVMPTLTINGTDLLAFRTDDEGHNIFILEAAYDI